jgi:hypothetical protein
MKYFTFIGIFTHIVFFLYLLFSLYNTSFNVADWGTNVDGFIALLIIVGFVSGITIFLDDKDF